MTSTTVSIFARDVVEEVRLKWWLTGSPLTGGQPITGPPPTSDGSGGGWWQMKHDASPLMDDQLLYWRAMLAGLRNGASPIIVPCYDIMIPLPDGITDAPVPFSDGAYFSDGAGFSSQLIDYRIQAGSALRDISMTVLKNTGADIRAGEFFTTVGEQYFEKLHLISRCFPRDGGLFDIEFSPPLREDMPADSLVDFQRPRCRMKMSLNNSDAAWPEYSAPFMAEPSITFEETWG